MLPSWANDTIVRLRAATVDDGHNNQTSDWAHPSELPITGCSVQPGSSQELLGGRDATITQYTVYAPAGIDVKATDRIRWAGDDWDVNGQPLRQGSVTGNLDHTLIALKEITG